LLPVVLSASKHAADENRFEKAPQLSGPKSKAVRTPTGGDAAPAASKARRSNLAGEAPTWDSSRAHRMSSANSRSSVPSPPNHRISWWLLAFLGAAVLAAYLPALKAGFIWDDDAHVTAPALQTWHGLGRIWFELGATQQYYPLLHSFFWLQHALWGNAPAGYHAVNLALHAANAVLVALVLRKLRIPGAALAALIFALHPIHVESVAWVSEQKNTLSALFYLAAVLAYLRFEPAYGDGGTPSAADDKPRLSGPCPTASRRWYAIATLLFLAALLTKSVTATLPAAILVIGWWRRGRLTWAQDVRPLVPWFGLAIASGAFTAWVEHTIIGAEGHAFDLNMAQRLVLAGHALWFYLGKLCWPVNLMFIYPRWTLVPTSVGAWLPLFAALAMTFLLWRVRSRSRAPLAAALFFGGTLLPALGFVNVYPFLYSFVADHFQYLASLGPITLAAAVAAQFSRSFAVASRFAAGLLIAVTLGVLTWRQSHIYRDADTLYRTTLQQNPECWMAANNLGKDLMASPAQLSDAIALFERALRLRPEYPEAENNLGLALTQSGRATEAIVHLERAIAMKPAFYQAHNNLGIAYARSGQTERAVRAFRRATELNPRMANVQENLAKALRVLGQDVEADQHFARAAELRRAAAADSP
jgi:protein O-mannosyl-transferase